MKLTIQPIILLLVAFLSIGSFIACTEEDSSDDDDDATSDDDDDNDDNDDDTSDDDDDTTTDDDDDTATDDDDDTATDDDDDTATDDDDDTATDDDDDTTSANMDEAIQICDDLENDGVDFEACGQPDYSDGHADCDWFICTYCYSFTATVELCETNPDSCASMPQSPDCLADIVVCTNNFDCSLYDLTEGSTTFGTECQTPFNDCNAQ